MDHRQLLQFHAIDTVHADPDAEDLSFELGEFVREKCHLVHAVRLLKISSKNTELPARNLHS